MPRASIASRSLMYDFELAKDKVLMGAERKSMLLTDEEKRVTAYHEAGHALVVGPARPLRPASTRSPSFRAAWRWASPCYLPDDDKHNYTRDYLETQSRHPDGRPHGRGDLPQPDVHRRRQRYRDAPPISPAAWSASTA